MLYIEKVLEPRELKVELPIILYVNSKGAKDLMNNWSVGGRTRHDDETYHFLVVVLLELKEQHHTMYSN
jgi:hypothetical protein